MKKVNPLNKTLSRVNNDLSLIMITFNNDGILNTSLKSLFCGVLLPSELIIIDNKSDTSTRKILKNFFKEIDRKISIKIIYNKKNFGFAKAVNQGVKLVSKDKKFIVLLNPDFILDKQALKELLFFLKNVEDKEKDKFILGGKAYNLIDKKETNTVANIPSFLTILIEFTSLKKIFDKLFFKNFSNFWNNDVFKKDTPQEVDSVSGCFMLFSKKIFEDLGGFDENFFLYLEDLDFCVRARRLGVKIYFIPRSFGFHYGGWSSKKSSYKIDVSAWDKSKRYFSLKYFGFFKGNLLNLAFYIDDRIIKFKKILFS